MSKEKRDRLADALVEAVRNYIDKDVVLCAVKDDIFNSEYVARVFDAGISRKDLISGNAYLLRQLIELQVLIDTDNALLIDMARIVFDTIDFNAFVKKYLEESV